MCAKALQQKHDSADSTDWLPAAYTKLAYTTKLPNLTRYWRNLGLVQIRKFECRTMATVTWQYQTIETLSVLST